MNWLRIGKVSAAMVFVGSTLSVVAWLVWAKPIADPATSIIWMTLSPFLYLVARSAERESR